MSIITFVRNLSNQEARHLFIPFLYTFISFTRKISDIHIFTIFPRSFSRFSKIMHRRKTNQLYHSNLIFKFQNKSRQIYPTSRKVKNFLQKFAIFLDQIGEIFRCIGDTLQCRANYWSSTSIRYNTIYQSFLDTRTTEGQEACQNYSTDISDTTAVPEVYLAFDKITFRFKRRRKKKQAKKIIHIYLIEPLKIQENGVAFLLFSFILFSFFDTVNVYA